MKILEEQDFLVGQVEVSRVGGWCCVRKLGYLGAWILYVLMQWKHADIYLSDCPHVDRLR